MDKIQMSELHRLPMKAKIKVVQSLWDDIAKDQANLTFPPEHKLILEERLNKINAGNSSFTSWEEVQKRYLKDLKE